MGHYFYCGQGRLSDGRRAAYETIAARRGVKFHATTGNSGSCECGHGCRLDTCPVKHWYFEASRAGTDAEAYTRLDVDSLNGGESHPMLSAWHRELAAIDAGPTAYRQTPKTARR